MGEISRIRIKIRPVRPERTHQPAIGECSHGIACCDFGIAEMAKIDAQTSRHIVPVTGIGEVLKIRPMDIQDRKIILAGPKSGKESEVVFIPQKVADRLKEYVKESGADPEQSGG